MTNTRQGHDRRGTSRHQGILYCGIEAHKSPKQVRKGRIRSCHSGKKHDAPRFLITESTETLGIAHRQNICRSGQSIDTEQGPRNFLRAIDRDCWLDESQPTVPAKLRPEIFCCPE